MSLVILGMEMPSGCQACAFADDEARFCKAAKEYIPMLSKPEFCPLRPLPEGYEQLEVDGRYLISVYPGPMEEPVIVEAEGD